jgi:hypothetical protein
MPDDAVPAGTSTATRPGTCTEAELMVLTAGMTVYELAQPSNTMSSFMSFNKRVPHPDFLAKLV